MATWYTGPAPHRWRLSENTLIFDNHISDLDGPPATPICSKPHSRSGISFPTEDIAWHTVLYGNGCANVEVAVAGTGTETARSCPTSAQHTCECE